MTEPLIGQHTEQPEICGCCLRLASPVAVYADRAHLLWLCQLCNTYHGMKVTAMNTQTVEQIEAIAIDKASSLTVEDVMSAMFTVLWGNGIRNLEAMNGENYKTIVAEIAASPDYRQALRKTLLAYSNHVRVAVVNTKVSEAVPG